MAYEFQIEVVSVSGVGYRRNGLQEHLNVTLTNGINTTRGERRKVGVSQMRRKGERLLFSVSSLYKWHGPGRFGSQHDITVHFGQFQTTSLQI